MIKGIMFVTNYIKLSNRTQIILNKTLEMALTSE